MQDTQHNWDSLNVFAWQHLGEHLVWPASQHIKCGWGNMEAITTCVLRIIWCHQSFYATLLCGLLHKPASIECGISDHFDSQRSGPHFRKPTSEEPTRPYNTEQDNNDFLWNKKIQIINIWFPDKGVKYVRRSAEFVRDMDAVLYENSTSAGNWARTCHSLFCWNNFTNMYVFLAHRQPSCLQRSSTQQRSTSLRHHYAQPRRPTISVTFLPFCTAILNMTAFFGSRIPDLTPIFWSGLNWICGLFSAFKNKNKKLQPSLDTKIKCIKHEPWKKSWKFFSLSIKVHTISTQVSVLIIQQIFCT